MTAEHTKAKLSLILAEQYAHRDRKKKKAPFLSKNLELVDQMWEEKYTRRHLDTLKRPEFSRQNLNNAAEACGPFPIDTCNLEDLANHLHATLKSKPSRLLRRIIWINSILSHLGRKTLDYPKMKRFKVRYLNETEFAAMLLHLEDATDRRLARIAFYTGMRLGEIFGLSPHHIKDGFLTIENQMTNIEEGDGFKEDTPKNGESRESFYPERVKGDLTEWAKTKLADREVIRLRRYSAVIKSACIKEFGSADRIKILSFRDLRHCHAIWLLQSGANMVEVAQQIGDGIEVCYRHYSGFELKKESIDRLRRLVDLPPKAQEIEDGTASKKA